MIALRRREERGHFDFGWLDTHHTFSFGDYHDPRNMGFRSLRVINDDRVKPGMGFPTHPHRDMEIVTYVVSGALEHRDSMGNGSVIRPGEVQRMTAGTGVLHSEYNPSDDEITRLLQIWILPAERGLEPSYEQTEFSEQQRRGRLRLVASPDGEAGSVTVHQDVRLYATLLEAGERVSHEIESGRHAWVQMVRGSARVVGLSLEAGDGVAVSDARELKIEALLDTELLLFDLA